MNLKSKGVPIVDFVMLDSSSPFDNELKECYIKLRFDGKSAYTKCIFIGEDFSDDLEFFVDTFFTDLKVFYDRSSDLLSFIEQQLVFKAHFENEADLFFTEDFQDFVETLNNNYSSCDSFLREIENIDLSGVFNIMDTNSFNDETLQS